jgi:hypothetical protein
MADLIDKPAEFPGGQGPGGIAVLIRAGFENVKGLLKNPKGRGGKKAVLQKQFQQVRKITGIVSAPARHEPQLRPGKDPAEFSQSRRTGKFFQFVPGYHGKIFMPNTLPDFR